MGASKLLHNRWFGKAIGGMAGLILTPPTWAASLMGTGIGIAIGAVFDRWAIRYLHPSALGRLFRARPASNARPTMQLTFAGMGRIAKSSGAVQAAHIDYAEHLMRRLDFSAADRHQAIVWFNAGKDPAFPFEELADECSSQLADEPILLEMLLECLCRNTIIEDNHVTRETLYRLTALLGIDAQTCDRYCAEVASLMDPAPAALANAYHVLQAGPDDSEKTVKTAYRRLVARHHPDRLDQNATPAEIRLAERRMAELSEALEIIEASR